MHMSSAEVRKDMYTMMQIWSTVSIGIVAAMAGFWFGRSRRWLLEEAQAGAEEYAPETVKGRETDAQVHSGRARNAGRKAPSGKGIGSPATGTVNAVYEGNYQGAVIHSNQGMLYAPASGKITKVYPLGHGFVMKTDLGTELFMQAGKPEDELLGGYYRPRVVRNEIVNKGKLLLEFDKEGLEAEGVDTSVYIGVNGPDTISDVTVTDAERIKAGETLLWVREYGAEV